MPTANAYFGSGQNSVLERCPRYVRFSSDDGHKTDFALFRACAKLGSISLRFLTLSRHYV